MRAALFPLHDNTKVPFRLPCFCRTSFCGLTNFSCSDVAAVNNVFIAGIHTDGQKYFKPCRDIIQKDLILSVKCVGLRA